MNTHFSELPDFGDLEPNYIGVPGVTSNFQYEVMTFSTTDRKKKSLDQLLEEAWTYNETLAGLGLRQPLYDEETDTYIPNAMDYQFWDEDGNRRTYKSGTVSSIATSSSIFHNASFFPIAAPPTTSSSPIASQNAAFAAAGITNANISSTKMTGTGFFFEPKRETPNAYNTTSNDNSTWTNVNAIATTTTGFYSQVGNNNDDDDDNDETSSVSSSSILTDSPSPLNLASDNESSSNSDSNVADMDEVNDSTSHFSSDSDDTEDSDAMAQRAAEGRLGEDHDAETHLVSGDIITYEGDIIPIGATPAKPKMAFNQLKKSSVISMLPEFLAQLEESNKKLEADKAAGKNVEIEAVGEDEPHIEMNLGLGVLEEQNKTLDDSGSEDDSSDGDVMAKLMGVSHKRTRDNDDADEEAGECSIKKPKIQEL